MTDKTVIEDFIAMMEELERQYKKYGLNHKNRDCTVKKLFLSSIMGSYPYIALKALVEDSNGSANDDLMRPWQGSQKAQGIADGLIQALAEECGGCAEVIKEIKTSNIITAPCRICFKQHHRQEAHICICDHEEDDH